MDVPPAACGLRQLALPPPFTAADVHAAYRQALKLCHLDAGGSDLMMRALITERHTALACATALMPIVQSDDRYRPNTGISRSIAPSQKRISAPPGSGTFAPFPGQEYVAMDVKPDAQAVANSSAESRQREFAAVSAGREPGWEAVARHAGYAKRRPACGDRG